MRDLSFLYERRLTRLFGWDYATTILSVLFSLPALFLRLERWWWYFGLNVFPWIFVGIQRDSRFQGGIQCGRIYVVFCFGHQVVVEEEAPLWVLYFFGAILLLQTLVERSVYYNLAWWAFYRTCGLGFSGPIFHNSEWWCGGSVYRWFRWWLLVRDSNVLVCISIDWIFFQTGWLWSFFFICNC